jgi:hypothetical protein
MDLAEISVGILRSLCRLLKIPETRKQFPVMCCYVSGYVHIGGIRNAVTILNGPYGAN